MNKIYFRYGTMFSGKSLDLISNYMTYSYNNKNVMVLKHSADTRDTGIIKSRMSTEVVPCILFDNKDSLCDVVAKQMKHQKNEKPDVILIDEIQFASEKHIEELHKLSDIAPIMCYGLKTTYTGDLFPSISKLLSLAEDISEIKTTCTMCGRKATHSLLIRNSKPLYEGAFVNIEGENNNDIYKAVCRKHFYDPIV